MSQILAVRVARILEHKFGCPVSAMVELVNTLWNCDEAELRRLFTEGRRFVLVVGKQPCGRMLFTEEKISQNEFIDVKAAVEAGLPVPVGLDIAKEYDRLCTALFLEDSEGLLS